MGLDWFVRTGAGLYPNEKILKFPSGNRNVSLDPSWEKDEVMDLFLAENPDEIDIEGETSWDFDGSESLIIPCSTLSEEDLKSFFEMTKRTAKYMAKTIGDLGCCRKLRHVIRTTVEEPIYTPAYRKSQAEREEIKKQIDEMLEAGIIRKSKSPWSSPIILVPKPNNTKRLCVDYRKLNKITVQQN